jgi:hypothetical protein
MKRKIKRSIGNIKGLIDDLKAYQKEIKDKRIIFIRRLMEVGIEMANTQLAEYAGMVVFEKTIDDEGGVIIAADREKIIRVWYTDKNLTKERSYEVSPLLLAEFGSGWLAEVLLPVEGVGQGTMPEQTHAFDRNGWYWYDEGGMKHHSYGEAPTHPLYYAVIEMQRQINEIAKEVFG